MKVALVEHIGKVFSVGKKSNKRVKTSEKITTFSTLLIKELKPPKLTTATSWNQLCNLKKQTNETSAYIHATSNIINRNIF